MPGVKIMSVRVRSERSKAEAPPQVRAACALAAATICAALFGVTPAVLEIIEYVRFSDAPGATFVARWALVLLFLGQVQVAYGLYLLLTPDRISVWIVTVVLLGIASVYAMGLAIAVVANANGGIAGTSGLQLSEELPGGRAALWCLCMVSVCTILAFFAGRLSFHWRRVEMLKRRAEH
jgi:hypothetical protein